MIETAQKFQEYYLKLKSVEGFIANRKMEILKKYRNSSAYHFLLQKTFEKFVGSICYSLKGKHIKMVAIRHYASNVSSGLN